MAANNAEIGRVEKLDNNIQAPYLTFSQYHHETYTVDSRYLELAFLE